MQCRIGMAGGGERVTRSLHGSRAAIAACARTQRAAIFWADNARLRIPPPMPKITIYTTSFCPYCHRAKRLLEEKGAQFEEIDVTGDWSARDALMEKAGGRTTVPQIWIGDTHVGGCDELYALERAGKLDALLAG